MNALLAKIEQGARHAKESPWHTKSGNPFGPWVDEDCSVMASDGRLIFSRDWKDACLNAANVDPETTLKLVGLIKAQHQSLINSLEFLTQAGVAKVRERHGSLSYREALTIYDSQPDKDRASVKAALAMWENLK